METETPVLTEKKSSKSPALTVLIVLLALAAIGLGVWGKMTNDKVTATLEAKAALETQYDGLFTKNGTTLTAFEAAKTGLETAKADLEKSQKELKGTQASLTKVQENIVKIQSDIDKALRYTAVLSGFLVEQESLMEKVKRIEATDDATLQEKYDTASRTGSDEDANVFFEHIIKAISALLK
jgi:chromosome segregation ATPase